MIIESGLVKAGLVKAGLVRAISNINTRYFRRNEGTTDYATIPEVTLSGDFVIEFDILPINESFHILSGSASNLRLFQSVSENKLEIATTSGFTRFTGLLALNTFSSCKLSRVSGIISLEVNGAELPISSGAANTGSFAFNQLFNVFGNATSVPRLSGILANLKIWDNGTLIRDYKLNDNSDILANSATVLGGELVVNGDFSDGLAGWSNHTLSEVINDKLIVYNLANGFSEAVRQFDTYEVGATYRVSFDYENDGGRASVFISPDGTFANSIANFSTESSGVHQLTFRAEVAGLFIIIARGGGAETPSVPSGAVFNNISIRRADGYGTVINGNADDWGLFQEQSTGEWLGQELITQTVWENPSTVGAQWSFANDQWTLTGDGSLSVLSLILSANQPSTMRLTGEALALTGQGLAVFQSSANSDALMSVGRYSVDIDKSINGAQQFKRQAGAVSATISKPSLKEVLNVA